VNDQRDCRLYRFFVTDPRTNYTTKTLGYVGESVRLPFQRMMEHIYEQPWADTIVGWEVDATVYPGKAAVLAAEEAAIKAERPLYNVEHNRGNPRRVKPWDAERQAAERGRMLRPQPRTTQRPQARATSQRRPTKRAADPAPPRWFGSVLAVSAVWVLLVVAFWIVRAEEWQGWDAPKNSAGWATGLMIGVGLLARSKRRKPKRRRSRR
jgi:hypothetical protein